MSGEEPGPIESPDRGNGVEAAVRLHRTVAAECPRRRVLLLHGLSNSAAVWNAVSRGWPEDTEVWAADLPWRGGFDATWSLSGDSSRWVRTAMELVPGGLDLLVAHSLSASLLLDALANGSLDPAEYGTSRSGDVEPRRQRTPGTVFVSPFYRSDPGDFEWESITTSLHDFERTIRDGIRLHAGGRLSDEKSEELGRLMCRKIGPYGWLCFFNLYLSTPWLLTERITSPCRVLVGESDAAAPPEEGFRLAENLPDARARSLSDCGHFPMIEAPEQFVAAASRFLAELDEPGTPQSAPETVNEVSA
ncbi:Pimeloyl-ACP methyl ester carboxylesterase [Actinopolyspora alba]|uniref:Pimeloyl-ACP methyl ester carboxylesterase n=1 Tax=Actinopolyspora alba TaxID=673379 RepID=A0A1I1TQ79_9ACTN|nr:alpha/beta hydrolase [Actinopolyspora alba]SFD60535.1 Pimeloyl-ACP methyl ester carboxylesterase [Actinopolyspora alba]